MKTFSIRRSSLLLGVLLVALTATMSWADAAPTPPSTPAAIAPTGLGTDFTEAKVVPIKPCRIADTRKDVRGVMRSGETRGFWVGDFGSAGLAQQGGPATGGCGVPSDASAVELTITAVSPTGTGFLRAYPAALTTEPQATFLNYMAGFNPTNTGLVQLLPREAIPTRRDLKVRVSAQTHVVIEVQAYTVKPMAALINQGGYFTHRSRAIVSQKESTGRYKVTFDQDVSNCAFGVQTGANILGGTGYAAAASYGVGDRQSAAVWTFDDTGQFSDHSFQITVTC